MVAFVQKVCLPGFTVENECRRNGIGDSASYVMLKVSPLKLEIRSFQPPLLPGGEH